ncbi:MAG: OmpH family outer membrane protein [Prevotellaceae bacterium]|jgi:outer membrane protein|nr:OmpH family outer membrane protein [Prevotellaceae bacterium]
MKNGSVILKAILAVAAIILFTLSFSSCGDSQSNVSKTDASIEGENKSIETIKDIAYVQIDSLIQSYDMYHDLKAEYEKKVKQMETEFTAKGRSFQKELEDYQEKGSKGLITRSQAEQMEQNLQRRQNELEQTRQNMGQQLAEQEAVMMRQITDAITKYINKYNETKNYLLILNNSIILYGHKSMDITTDIIKGLNEEYIQNRNNPAK